MSRLIIILTLFAFLAGGLANVAHASMPDEICSHQTVDIDNTNQDCLDDTDNQDKADLEQCQDCCCHHTHVIAKIAPKSTTHLNVKTGVVFAPTEAQRSRTLSPLYRPPIA